MPNYVRNILRMSGIADEPLFTIDEYGDKNFDFNKLIPMPEELRIDSGSKTDDSLAALILKLLPHQMWIRAKDPQDAMMQKFRQRIGNDENQLDRLAKEGMTYARNIVEYGVPTWYEWCCEHWGTKWNAGRTCIPDSNEIVFETAWNDPAPVIAALAERYPERRIEHWWADEDIGQNTGYRMWEEGVMSEVDYAGGSQEAFENYGYVWEEDVEDGEYLFRGEDGLIRFRE